MKLRGESMQAAADAKASGMVSVIGLDSDKVAELCKVRGGRAMRGLRGGGRGQVAWLLWWPVGGVPGMGEYQGQVMSGKPRA